jgi:DNA repair exonuclease SbcCD ATPase subunit
MLPDEKKEKQKLESEILYREEQNSQAKEKVEDLKERAQAYAETQRPKDRAAVLAEHEPQIKKAEIQVHLLRADLKNRKEELDLLLKRIERRKKEEQEQLERRAKELPEIAMKKGSMILDLAEEISAWVEEVKERKRIKALAERYVKTIITYVDLQMESEHLRLAHGLKTPEIPEIVFPLCEKEVQSSYEFDFGKKVFVRRSLTRHSRVASMRADIADAKALNKAS